MNRYIRSDELYHFGRSKKDGAPGPGTGNWKRGRGRGTKALYEYADGKKTPLARFRESDKSGMTGAEKLKAYKDAALNTAAGYGLLRYKKTTETIKKGDSKLTRKMKQIALDDKKRADAAFEARIKKKQEKAAAKAKELAERVKREDEALEARRLAAEKAKKDQEEASAKQKLEQQQKNEKYAEARKEQVKEYKEEVKEQAAQKEAKMHEDNVNQAKQGRWENFSDEDLTNYVNRVNLEAKATEAMLLKMDAPRKVVDEISKYGKTAVDAYQSYKNVFEIVKSYKREMVPPESVSAPTPKAQKTYTDIVKEQTFDYIKKTYGNEPNAGAFDKQTLQDWIDIIEKINKLDPTPKS